MSHLYENVSNVQLGVGYRAAAAVINGLQVGAQVAQTGLRLAAKTGIFAAWFVSGAAAQVFVCKNTTSDIHLAGVPIPDYTCEETSLVNNLTYSVAALGAATVGLAAISLGLACKLRQSRERLSELTDCGLTSTEMTRALFDAANAKRLQSLELSTIEEEK